jgi:carbon-monoxide dehydrogenase iron sulfur subunit
MHDILVLWERCNGCGDCLVACKAEMARQGKPQPHVPRLDIRGQEQPAYIALCRHCAEAPCRDACISGAITLTGSGRVELSDEICVRCCMCLAHCPFGAMALVGNHVIKCDICTRPGVAPPCVKACPKGALATGTAERLSNARGRERANRKMDAVYPQVLPGNQISSTMTLMPDRPTALRSNLYVCPDQSGRAWPEQSER